MARGHETHGGHLDRNGGPGQTRDPYQAESAEASSSQAESAEAFTSQAESAEASQAEAEEASGNAAEAARLREAGRVVAAEVATAPSTTEAVQAQAFGHFSQTS